MFFSREISVLNRKRDFVIEKQIAWHFFYTKCHQTLLSFYATQIINPSHNSIISANHEKGENLSQQL